MPEAQTLNSILSAYGVSSLLGSGGFHVSHLMAAFIFGIIGLCGFLYGRKAKSVKSIVLGLLLMVYPYFIANTILMYVIGVVLTIALFLWRD